MDFNLQVILFAGVIPMIIQYFWYHPRAFGRNQLINSKSTVERSTSTRFLLLLATYIIGLLIAFALMGMTVHQLGIIQVLSEQPGFGNPDSEVQETLDNFMATFGYEHRNYVHGMLHGVVAAVTLALPLIAFSAILEGKGWKYISCHFGFWLISMIIMSALICHFL